MTDRNTDGRAHDTRPTPDARAEDRRPAPDARAGSGTSPRPIPKASGEAPPPAPRRRSAWTTIRGERGRTRKLRKLLALLRPYRAKVILMFVALFLATGAALAPPYLLGLAIDDGIRAGDATALTWITIAFLVAGALNFAATYAQTYLTGWVGQRALADLRRRIFAHLQTLSIGFYSRNRSGVLISRLTNDVQALDSLVTDGIVTLFAASLTLIGTAAILVWLDAGLALVTFLVFPILFVASLVFRIASADAYRLTREKIALVTAYLQETLSGVRIVRAFGQEPRHERQFSGLNDENRDANMKTVYLNAAYFPAVELLSAVATAAILIYGGSQVLDGAVEIGVLASFVFYLQSFFDPIQQLSQLYTTYQSGMAALDKIFGLLDEEPDVRDADHAIDLPPIRGRIVFDHVSFSYAAPDATDPAPDDRAEGDHSPATIPKSPGDGPPRPTATPAAAPPRPTATPSLALDDVTLDIPPGQTVALVGSTGAGKSTLAKLVARFYDPTAGRVLIDGHDLRDVRERSLRAQLGIVPQESFLFSGTIRDNIAFGADDDAPAGTIEEAARAVGAHEFIERLPDGYDTEVGERGAQLSAGQRQLVAFARAAAADPRILILDEATSNVDVHTEAGIERGLRRLLAGRTAIVIAHRLSTIRDAGRIVVLDHGRIAEQGTHDELLAADGAYARLYRDWAEQAAA